MLPIGVDVVMTAEYDGYQQERDQSDGAHPLTFATVGEHRRH